MMTIYLRRFVTVLKQTIKGLKALFVLRSNWFIWQLQLESTVQMHLWASDPGISSELLLVESLRTHLSNDHTLLLVVGFRLERIGPGKTRSHQHQSKLCRLLQLCPLGLAETAHVGSNELTLQSIDRSHKPGTAWERCKLVQSCQRMLRSQQRLRQQTRKLWH